MNQKFILLFFILCLLNLFGEYHYNSTLIFATKPLLLSTLSIHFFLNSTTLPSTFRKAILGGLIASIAGDTFLMFVENKEGYEHFFLLGLGSFLITHLLYLFGFSSFPSQVKGWVAQRPWMLFFFVAYLLANCIFLWPDLPKNLKVPVIVYSTAIVAMTVAALNLKGKILAPAFQLLIAGVLLFVCSDSIIALNKFKSTQLSLPYPRLLIMVTYLVGQYLIVQGCLRSIDASQ